MIATLTDRKVMPWTYLTNEASFSGIAPGQIVEELCFTYDGKPLFPKLRDVYQHPECIVDETERAQLCQLIARVANGCIDYAKETAGLVIVHYAALKPEPPLETEEPPVVDCNTPIVEEETTPYLPDDALLDLHSVRNFMYQIAEHRQLALQEAEVPLELRLNLSDLYTNLVIKEKEIIAGLLKRLGNSGFLRPGILQALHRLQNNVIKVTNGLSTRNAINEAAGSHVSLVPPLREFVCTRSVSEWDRSPYQYCLTAQ